MDALPRGTPQEGRVREAGGESPQGLLAPGVGRGLSTVGGSCPPGSCHPPCCVPPGGYFQVGE